MKIYKASISQCSGQNFWYRDMIGQTVFVIRNDPMLGFQDIQIGIHDSMPMGKFYDCRDLAIIEEFDGDIIERVTIAFVRKDKKSLA